MSLFFYYLRGEGLIRCKTFEDVKNVYGEENLIKIHKIKQIVTYAVLKCQPVWIDEGQGGVMIAYYYKPETELAWKYWLEHAPNKNE